MKGSLKRLLALLIALLAILLGVASLFSRSRWLPVFSWGVMALSLALALAALVQSDRRHAACRRPEQIRGNHDK
jgi:uncharacterized membrane protein HdeD (DUF308 family)